MVKVKTELVTNAKANRVTFGKGAWKKKKVVIHQTGNTKKGANAAMHSKLQRNGFSASWHETVDDKEAIINFTPEWQCFHAGDGRGTGNLHGYGIELCINSDGNYKQTIENGAERAAYWLKQFGLPISELEQHNHFSGKNCPAQLRAGKDGITWNDFVKKVEGYMTGKPAKTPVKTPTAAPAKKSNATIAKEVKAGKWGNNPKRKKDLEAAGYNYQAIQDIVNGKTAPAKKSNDTIAKEVIAGKWGNNPKRKKDLEAAGYNYNAIQKIVNKKV